MRNVSFLFLALLALPLLIPALSGSAHATDRWGVTAPQAPVAPDGQAVLGVRGLPEPRLRGSRCEVKGPGGRTARQHTSPERDELRYPADFGAPSPMPQGLYRVRWRAGRDCRQANFLVLDAAHPIKNAEELQRQAGQAGRCR
ncbi:hypothetical protein [Fundidesulfovibrio agrisoli]|uniref:hypothetical protein n=1 Tax=Fundidesulfovibrio agrisoli TaxID=2922717 RepID=UPI001FAC74EF|nr:hypothetical protein [Fundidesulfovibrio agrisoli]